MKALTAIALTLAVSAQAQSVTTDSGDSEWTLLPGTVRSYINSNKVRQYDALFDYTSKAPKASDRTRFGVTGCGTNDGLIAIVSPTGVPLGRVNEWAMSGNRVFDELARIICAQAASGNATSL